MPAIPRILVLEDEPLIAIMVQGWLTELGCETVGPAHTVSNALALIEEGPLDGAILDVSIGDQDCSPVADALRHLGVPFALATGRAPDGLTDTYADAPSLPKPYDFAAVRGVLAGLLGNRAGPDLRRPTTGQALPRPTISRCRVVAGGDRTRVRTRLPVTVRKPQP